MLRLFARHSPTATGPRPAGSSNDPPLPRPTQQQQQQQQQQQAQQQQQQPQPAVAALGYPFTNPQVNSRQAAPVPFPIHDSTTGDRPQIVYGWWTNTDNAWSQELASERQRCHFCGPGSPTQDCPAYRYIGALGTDRRGSAMVSACCSMKNCGVPLCPQHLLPNARGSADRRHKYCPSCITSTPRCTSCGIQGIDRMFNIHRETGGHHHHKQRGITLWPCGQGCFNLLCQRCGTSQDGCN